MSTIFQTRSILPPDPHHPEVPSEKPGIDGFVNALAIDSVQASLNHTFDDLSFRPDPQFDLEKHFDNLTAGLDPAYWPQFGYAVSMDHAVDIRRRMSEQQFADRSLQASGRWAIAGKIGAGFLDPPQALAMLATAGAGGAFGAGGIAVKGERLQAAVRAGLVGAEINAATTAFESTQKPTITANDVMRSALMGFGMGAAGPATAGSGRAARFAMGGAMSAAPTLAYDFAGRVTGLSDTDARDMQAEALQNFVIGGAFTALHRTNTIREVASEAERAAVMRQREVMARDAAATELYEKVARSYYKDLQFRDIAEAARKIGKTPEQVMTPEGASQFSDQLAALQHNRTITPEEVAAAKPMDFGTTARNEPAPIGSENGPAKAIGAAAPSDPGFLNMRVQDDPRPKKLPGDLIIQESSDALPTFGAKVRLGISNAGFAPDGPLMSNIRRAYNAVFYDPIAKRDGSMGGEAATWSYGERRGAHAQAERSERNAYVKHKDFAKANGQKPDGVREFNQKVTEYRRSRGKLWADDPGVKAHSDFLNGLYEKELARQQRHGVVNAENVKPDPWHTPRVWVPQLVDQLRNRAGHEGLAEGIAKRITGDVNPALRRVYAEAILRVQMDKHWGTDVAVGHLLEGDGQMLVDVIRQIDKNLTEKQARDMVFYQKPDAPEGTPQWLRRRIALDETTPMDLIDQRTGEAFQQPISSMLNNDATELARRYVDHSVGSSTLSELFHSFARGDEKVPTTIKEFLDNLRIRMNAEGVPASEIDPHLDRIEHGLKRLGGQPVRKYTDVDHWLRALTNLQFIRTMSSVVSGIQNYQQVGEAMAQGGWSVAIKSIPEILNIRQMMLRTDGVHLDNTTLRELEAIGHGDSPMSHRPRMFAPDENLGEMSAARKAAYWSARAAQVSGKLSLQEWSSKHAAYAAGIVFKNTWAEMVGSGRPMGTGKNAKRLANLAMRPEMADRIAAMIREHAVTEKTASGLKIKSFDTSAWVNDPEAASAFNIAQGRFIERVSGEGNETDLPLWMSSSTANVMLQLRKFVAKQWSGKTLYAIDQARRGQYAAVATQLVTTSAWSGLLYMARVYVQSIGREDRQDYLEKMLADDKIWKAGIGRNDALSLLPWMVDVASIGTGAPEPIFAFARSSEMREAKGRFGQVLAPPAIAWAEGVYGATSALGGSLFYDDYTFSKDDLESVATGLAIPNVFNLSTITKKAIASEYDLPTKSRTQHRSQP